MLTYASQRKQRESSAVTRLTGDSSRTLGRGMGLGAREGWPESLKGWVW